MGEQGETNGRPDSREGLHGILNMAAPVHLLASNHGLDRNSLAKAFDVMGMEERPEVKNLTGYIRDCIRNGIDRNRKDYRLFKAMDWAYDAPFYQVSYTQLRGLLNSKPDDKKVLETIRQWGLTHLLPDIMDANGCPTCDEGGARRKALNLPVFFNIFIPLVMAYVTIRWAKLFNERNLVPLYKYEPVQFTKENRARCEILTQAVQRQAAWFDYPSDEAQSILQTLLYGICINFPRECWYVEKQLGEDGKEKIVKEGVRFNMPHPSRTYHDLYNRLSTLNSNSGCEYAGYWDLCRYRDIKANPLYFNKERIAYGGQEYFDLGSSDFLEQVNPCNMSFPDAAVNRSNGIGGTGALDRLTEANYYSDNDGDAATLLTQHFQYLVPKDWGLGDYPHRILMRFVVAGCDTVVWAEPLAYDRLPVYAYDADFNRSRFNSLGLQIIPFQDMIGNLFTQWIYSVKENLRNPVFYDKDKVPTEYVQQLLNLGNKMMEGRAYIPYSSTIFQRMGERQQEAFFTPPFARHNTAELASLISGILDMLERTLQFSSQELGQPASHEQSATETRIVASYTDNRVELTAGFIDRAIYAKKGLLYDAMMAYADKEIVVGISSSFAATEEEFKKLIKAVGFTIADESAFDPEEPDSMRKVKGDKSALILQTFASTRDARNRIDNPAIADAMSKIFGAIAQNPVLIQSIGSVQLVELLNQIVIAAGLPKEFKLRGKKIDTAAPPEEQAQQVGQLITEFSKQVKEAIEQSQAQTLEAAARQTAQIVEQALRAAGQQTSQAVGAVAEGLAQQGELNQAQTRAMQQQEQQMQQLALAVAQLNQKIEYELRNA